MARSKKTECLPLERIGVIYARYSSHNQKEESIEQQVEECTSFALLNGIKIVHVYADKALSGRTDKRPQFQRLMRDAEKRSFSVVVAYKSNRIARDMLNANMSMQQVAALTKLTLPEVQQLQKARN